MKKKNNLKIQYFNSLYIFIFFIPNQAQARVEPANQAPASGTNNTQPTTNTKTKKSLQSAFRLIVLVSGAFWGVDRDQITLRGAQTTVLRIADGKIRSATDLVDYAGVTGQVEALQAQYGEVPIQ